MTINFTWLGTASHLLDIDGKRVLSNPFFYRNERSNPILNIKREDIKNIDAVFISHGHFDHCMDAAWFAENLDIPVYCSTTAKENMIRFASGVSIDGISFNLSERGIKNIRPINSFRKIKISNGIIVEPIKSKHTRLDFESILYRLRLREFWSQISSLLPYGRNFPKGKIIGYCTFINEIKIVFFGSLFHKYSDILKKYVNCDVFIAPLAGNSAKNISRKGTVMVNYLKPKLIIPVHWDDFFPPISRTEDIGFFCARVRGLDDKINIITPTIRENILIKN